MMMIGTFTYLSNLSEVSKSYIHVMIMKGPCSPRLDSLFSKYSSNQSSTELISLYIFPQVSLLFLLFSRLSCIISWSSIALFFDSKLEPLSASKHLTAACVLFYARIFFHSPIPISRFKLPCFFIVWETTPSNNAVGCMCNPQ